VIVISLPVFFPTNRRLLQRAYPTQGSKACRVRAARRSVVITLCLLGPLAGLAQQVPQLQLQSTRLEGPGWRLENSRLALNADELTLRAESAQLQHLALALTQVQISCQPIITPSAWHCDPAAFKARLAERPVSGQFRLDYRPTSNELTLASERLQWGNNSTAVQFHSVGADWQASFPSLALELAELESLLSVSGLSFSGRLAGELQLNSRAGQSLQAQWHMQTSTLSFNSDDGRHAGENLGGVLSGRWRGDGRVQAELKLQTGQLLVQPLFWDFKQTPALALQLSALVRQEQTWQLDRLIVEQPGLGQFSASGRLNLAAEEPLQDLRLTVSDTDLSRLATQYLKPLLAGSALADFEASGQADAALGLSQGRLQALELNLADTMLALPDARWTVEGLNGRLALGPEVDNVDSELRWRSGTVYRLNFGAGTLAFNSHAGGLQLRQAVRIPLMDGALHIEHLQAENILGATPVWRFGGRLEAISMTALSEALDWPSLAGQLGGVIPAAVYRNDQIEVTGTLRVDVFDGVVYIDDLRLANLFSANPEVFANIRIAHLDLETLTRTFDFGKIEGRLDGWIHDLHLQDWQPVAFDARFFSPEDDDRRRRISQRAVESISSLGGGNPTALLSRGFLGLFESFRYRRLGFGCRLERGICQMLGIGPAPGVDGGFYLVEGSGLPRIDVIAYNRLVDWADLLARLKAAAQSEGPVVR